MIPYRIETRISPRGDKEGSMYGVSADFYDKLYSFKDYRKEAGEISRLIKEANPSARSLLDLACGTGVHLSFLKADFTVEGLDISPRMIAAAKAKNPDIDFHIGSLVSFRLGKRYDAVTCLFSSIGYVRTLKNLRRAIRNMALHLAEGGVLLVEPWFVPEAWHPGTVHALLVDEPKLKIARLSTSLMRRGESYMEMHYLVALPAGTRHFVELHRMGLFTREETKEAFEAAGLSVEYREEGITGRGLYIGVLRGDEGKSGSGKISS